MTTVSKEDKRTRNRRRTSNNTNNTNTKENRPASRGRRNLKKNEEKAPVPEKPVIGSSNPFFIAVCAPDSYKPAALAPNTMTVQQRVKPNVFLRSRPRSAAYSNSDSGSGSGSGGGSGGGGGSGYSNRFIHHPALQQSRHSETSASAASPSSDASGYVQNNVISISDFTHFPSLGANTEGVAAVAVAAAAPVKLNFKEMMMRSTSVASPSVASVASVASPSVASVASVTSDVRSVTSVTSVASSIIHQKILSSSNIFLAAFQPSVSHDDDYDDNDDNADVVSAGNKRQPELASSVLIDSCDNKYDRLYK